MSSLATAPDQGVSTSRAAPTELSSSRAPASTWSSTTPSPGVDSSSVVRDVVTGYVAQARAVNGHGIALATEIVTFGLAGEPTYAWGRRFLFPCTRRGTGRHYATDERGRLTLYFSNWLHVTPPWSEVSEVGHLEAVAGCELGLLHG